MSEHSHGHHEREPWKEKLAHAFRELKEADNDRDVRLRRNQEAVQRIFREVFPPVLAQFQKDAREYGFQAEVSAQQHGGHRLTLQGPPPTSCTIEFRPEATPEVVKLLAFRTGAPGFVDLIQNKNPDQFREADLGEYLAAQLLEIRPKKR
jgi:hypothetical protein